MFSNPLTNKSPVFFIFSLLLAILFFISFASVLSLFPGLFLSAAQNSSTSSFLYQDMISTQENFEGFLYIVGIILVPAGAFFLYTKLHFLENKNLGIAITKLYWLIAVMSGVYVYLNYFWLKYYMVTYCLSLLSFSLLILLGLAVVFRHSYDTTRYQSKIIFTAGVALILLTALTQVNTAQSLIADYRALYHFSNIMGVTNQLHHGQAILVNTTSLYGIAYPYFALFFTKIAGYNIISLSLFFVLLIFLSYLFFYLTLGEISGYRSWFTLLMLVVLLGLSYPYYINVHLNEEIFNKLRVDSPYYQYHPIRVIFCAFFVWFALKYGQRENRFYYWLGMYMTALGVFWNFDSGIALLFAWVGFLIYRDLSNKARSLAKKNFLAGRHIVIILLCLGSLVIAYSLFAYFSTHRFPIWSNLFLFHKLFVTYGFFMLPMYPFDYWHMQIGVYVTLLVSCLLKLWRKESTDRDAYFFFLAVLGIGLFRYYVGRSAIFNLYPGSYPAVIILAMVLQGLSAQYHPADYRITNFTKSNLFRYNVLKIIVCVILANYGLVVFASHGQDLLYQVGKKWQFLKNSRSPTEIDAAVNYINQTKKSEEVFIFSSLAEYLYIQTSTYSPLPYSCLNEVFTEAQGQQIKEMIENKEIKQIYFILKSKTFKENGFAYLARFIVPTIERCYRRVKRVQLDSDLAVVLFEP